MTPVDADITIVGSGMVGATLACALAHSGYSILIVDRNPPPEYPGDDYSLRVSAINVAAQTVFTHVDAWAAMARVRVSPMEAMEVWDKAGAGRTRFDAADIGEPCLGHIVENTVVTRALIDAAAQHASIETRWPCDVASLSEHDESVEIALEDGRRIRTRLVVGADGARSRVRELAGIDATTHDYQQRTLVAICETEKDHEATAWQRFLPSGPLALLPLAGGLSSLAFHSNHDVAAELEALSPDALADRIEKEFDGRLGRVRLVSAVGGFNLHRMHATRYSSGRVVLVGDAAHAVHPLAGLGANIGFMDAATLAETLMEKPERDPADPRSLRRYERARRGQNSGVIATTDAFKHVFGSEISAVEQLRNTGLSTANALRPAKSTVMRYAMGINGDVPAIARRGAS